MRSWKYRTTTDIFCFRDDNDVPLCWNKKNNNHWKIFTVAIYFLQIFFSSFSSKKIFLKVRVEKFVFVIVGEITDRMDFMIIIIIVIYFSFSHQTELSKRHLKINILKISVDHLQNFNFKKKKSEEKENFSESFPH